MSHKPVTTAPKTLLQKGLESSALALLVDVGATLILSAEKPALSELFTIFAVSASVYAMRATAKECGWTYIASSVLGGAKHFVLAKKNHMYSGLVGALSTTMYAFSGVHSPLVLDLSAPIVVETMEGYLKGSDLTLELLWGSLTVTSLVALYVAVDYCSKSAMPEAINNIKTNCLSLGNWVYATATWPKVHEHAL